MSNFIFTKEPSDLYKSVNMREEALDEIICATGHAMYCLEGVPKKWTKHECNGPIFTSNPAVSTEIDCIFDALRHEWTDSNNIHRGEKLRKWLSENCKEEEIDEYDYDAFVTESHLVYTETDLAMYSISVFYSDIFRGDPVLTIAARDKRYLGDSTSATNHLIAQAKKHDAFALAKEACYYLLAQAQDDPELKKELSRSVHELIFLNADQR